MIIDGTYAVHAHARSVLHLIARDFQPEPY
jgi:hypothetical protein